MAIFRVATDRKRCPTPIASANPVLAQQLRRHAAGRHLERRQGDGIYRDGQADCEHEEGDTSSAISHKPGTPIQSAQRGKLGHPFLRDNVAFHNEENAV